MRLLWIVLALLCYSIVTSAAQVIEMISPYDNPPFVVDQKKEQGLVYDLASLLTVRSQGKYQFKVVVVPRARLQKMLLRSGVYVVPLVSPKWFGDENEKKYLWTSALMEDENLVLSPRKRALEYENSASLQGKRTSIVLGHAIEPLDQLEKGGTVKTESTQSLNNGLRMLARGRIDFMVMGRMVAIYLIRDLGLEDEIHISDKSLERLTGRSWCHRSPKKNCTSGWKVKSSACAGLVSGRSICVWKCLYRTTMSRPTRNSFETF